MAPKLLSSPNKKAAISQDSGPDFIIGGGELRRQETFFQQLLAQLLVALILQLGHELLRLHRGHSALAHTGGYLLEAMILNLAAANTPGTLV